MCRSGSHLTAVQSRCSLSKIFRPAGSTIVFELVLRMGSTNQSRSKIVVAVPLWATQPKAIEHLEVALPTGKRRQQSARTAISSQLIRRASLTIATNMFFILRSQVASNSIGLRLAFHIRTKATSPAGRTRAEPTFAVAVTRGLFPMKRFRAGRKSDRIPRLFRSNWLNGASICTEHRACIQCSTHFSVSGIQPWQLIAAV